MQQNVFEILEGNDADDAHHYAAVVTEAAAADDDACW